jgi:acetyltransferase-like isoleucine patch superfamily enzyme
MLSEARKAPWKVWNEVWRWLAYPRVRLAFTLNGISWGQGWRCYGVPVIQRYHQSKMMFGDGLQLRSSVRSTPLGPYHPVMICTLNKNAIIEIGNNFGMNGGAICAAQQITIGHNVNVGANTTIVDTDFHPLNVAERQTRPNDATTAPIIIEDDVFIGMNCLILKGVRLGQGSVVGAGSVVTRSVPPGSIIAGNPARVIRRIRGEAETDLSGQFTSPTNPLAIHT